MAKEDVEVQEQALDNELSSGQSAEQSQQVEVPEPKDSEKAEPEDKGVKTTQEPSPQAGNPTWFKPDAFKLKYRGQTVSPKDYQHAVNLMQQGWSYTEAMAQLKREKESIEQVKGRFGQYEQLENAFQKNPAFAQKIWQMYQEAVGQGQVQQQHSAQPDPQYQQLFQTVNSLQERLRSWDEQQADQEVNREIQDLKSKLPDVQWDQVTETGHTLMYDILSHAHHNKFPNLIAAARDYLWDTQVANAKMAGAQQVANAKQRASKAGVVSTGANAPAQPTQKTVNVRDVSYDDLARMAVESLKR